MQILLTEVLFLSLINQIYNSEKDAFERKKAASEQADAILDEAQISAESQSKHIISLAKAKAAFITEKSRINSVSKQKNVESLADSYNLSLERTCSANMSKTVDKILSFIIK